MRLIYKLKFNGRVHFGINSLNNSNNTFSSNRLFSALFIEAIKNNKDTSFLFSLLFSNAFPYKIDKDKINYFVPKPICSIERKEKNGDEALEDRKNAKKAKKLDYINIEEISSYLKGEHNLEAIKFGENQSDIKAQILRIVKDKKATELFEVGSYKFREDAGVWFFVDYSNDEDIEKLEELLNSLQYSGIGGKRSSGFGRFIYEKIKEIPLTLQEPNDVKRNSKLLLLSSAFPKEEEIDNALENAQYLTWKSSGWIHPKEGDSSIFRKKDIFKFAPGSTFQNKWEGDFFDVGDNLENPIYNYSKAIFIGIGE